MANPRVALRGPHPPIKIGKASIRVRGSNGLQPKAEPRQSYRHIRLDADNDHLGTAKPYNGREIAQSAGCKGIHYVKSGQVHDDAARPAAADLLDDPIAKLCEIVIDQRGGYGGNEAGALLLNWNIH